jgi:hypothetical protein
LLDSSGFGSVPSLPRAVGSVPSFPFGAAPFGIEPEAGAGERDMGAESLFAD